MFSKELYELDRNTVQYMIDEMQDAIDTQKDELDKHAHYEITNIFWGKFAFTINSSNDLLKQWGDYVMMFL